MNQKEAILKVMGTVVDPWMNMDYLSARMVKVADDASSVTVQLGYPAKGVKDEIKTRVEEALRAAGIQTDVKIEQNIIAHAVQRTLKVLPNLAATLEDKNIIETADIILTSATPSIWNPDNKI